MKYAIKKSNENFVFHGYKELRKTTAGKTGIGLEVVIDGAVAQKDMNKATIMAFYDHGFKWMMPKYENRELVRPGFFYKGFDTKAKRDKQYDSFMKENKKFAEPKKAEPKKAEPKAETNLDLEKALKKMTKAQLVEMLTKALV